MAGIIRRVFLRGGSPDDPEVRRRAGARAGAVGIGLNLLLFLGKLSAGLISSSVAMVADAVNNLSDAATSVVTLVGFHLAGRAADAGHPFGHGRAEYVSGLIVSLAILLMGLELGRTSLTALFEEADPRSSPLSVGILVCAIGVKLAMFLGNRSLGRLLNSDTLEAVAADSLSDAASTGVVLLSALVGPWTRLPVDALAGLLVAVLILHTGWEAARNTLDPLLGRPMNSELAEDIDRLVLSHENILGIHDLIYHDYGPGRAMMSFHAEVPADGDLLALHDVIDHIERELKSRHHIDTVIHMDPVVKDARTDALRIQVEQMARQLDEAISIHDFRITAGPHHTNVIFDVLVPFGFRLTDAQVTAELTRGLKALSSRYYPVIQVDHSYVDREQEEKPHRSFTSSGSGRTGQAKQDKRGAYHGEKGSHRGG